MSNNSTEKLDKINLYKEKIKEKLTRSKFNNPYMQKIYDFKKIVIKTENLKQTINNKLTKFKAFHIDFGCGNGELLESLAKKSPNTLFLGVELQYKELYRSAKRFDTAKLNNVLLVREKAEFIPTIIEDIVINSSTIYFPDPWPKNKHRNHRLLSSFFFKSLNNLLNKSALLYIKTDSDQYFTEILENIKYLDFLQIKTLSRDAHNINYKSQYKLDIPPTAFERIFINQEQMINYLVLEKN